MFKRLFKAKIREGQSVHDHGLTMIKDWEELKKLSMIMHKKLQTDLIPQSLPASYEQFIVNYHMNKTVCTKTKLLNKLVTTLGILKSSRGIFLTVELASTSKKKSTWKKKKPAKKQKTEKEPSKKVPKKWPIARESVSIALWTAIGRGTILHT